MTAPQWLQLAITEGLQGLIVLRLRNSPAQETIKAVAKVWIAAVETWPIAWDEAQDHGRIRGAFRTLAANSDYWPAPATLKAAMPPRADQFKLAAPVSNRMPPGVREKLFGILRKDFVE